MRTNSHPASFADFSLRKKKQTRTWIFLERANTVIDFRFSNKIHDMLYSNELWRKPYDTLIKLKIILLQKWFWLSDSKAEEEIYDKKSFQEFLWLWEDDDIPDETTICRFRKLLRENKLDDFLFSEIDKQIESNDLKITTGRIIDATIIETPKWRKKDDGDNTRDKEAWFTKKNWRWYHWYKDHISTDLNWNFIQKTFTSSATDHDSKHEDKITDWNEKALFKDSAYINKEQKKEMRKDWRYYWVVERAVRWHPLSTKQEKRNKKNSSIRVKVEHPFAEIKCRMRYVARYVWLEKNSFDFKLVATAYNLKRMIWMFFKAQKQAVITVT